MANCAGCKWLDRYKRDGDGYCCHVERSEQGKEYRQWLREHPGRVAQSPKIRRPDMERCELYEVGDFEARYGS